MRIIAGTGSGRRFRAPRGYDTRPTADRVREALFNILAPRLPGSRFLDLYAGSGAVGLEALSRGAAEVVFVEKYRPTAALIRKNIERLRLGGTARVCGADVRAFLQDRRSHGGLFGIIFLDPPYGAGDTGRILRLIGRSGLISDEGVVVVESAHKVMPPERVDNLVSVGRRRYGDAALSFYQSEET